MKSLFFVPLLLAAFVINPTALAYDNPPSLCYEGCTPWMIKLEQDYYNSEAIPFDPTVYSGICRIIGNFDPETDHHAVMMIDHKEQLTRNIEPYFSVILSFFAGENEYVGWNLNQARREMSPYWKEHGNMIHAGPTSRVEIPYEDGSGPAFTYWMRYNPELREAFLITYMGIYNKVLCRLKAHE